MFRNDRHNFADNGNLSISADRCEYDWQCGVSGRCTTDLDGETNRCTFWANKETSLVGENCDNHDDCESTYCNGHGKCAYTKPSVSIPNISSEQINWDELTKFECTSNHECVDSCGVFRGEDYTKYCISSVTMHESDELGTAINLPLNAPCKYVDSPEDEIQCGNTSNNNDGITFDLIY